MKKILLVFIAAAGISFFGSCEKETASLEGTSWKDDITDDERGPVCELDFTSEKVTFSRISSDGTILDPSLTGTYTYDNSTVTLRLESMGMDGKMYTQTCVGAIKRKTMNIQIVTGDILWTLELEKQ
jgi:hypothetical protein